MKRDTRPLRRKSPVRLKDPFSALSHAVGALLGIVGLVLLLVWSHGKPWHTTAFSIYGATLILLFVSSALYHSLSVSEKVENILYGLDRTGIYLLIAGTYTPLCLIPLRGVWGWTLLGIIWGLAIIGIIVDWATQCKAPHWLQGVLFVLMGWVFLIAIGPMLKTMTLAQLAWLGAGGLIYSLGAGICVKYPKPTPGRAFDYHDFWHLLVLIASACHFVLMSLL
ncbi:PAQR family membrane homeostasis protein TrhA [Armatimonas rosea]|uniref:Hemolysin III n=1 Tax=Armatimonas rosea TaxID=685828 RepID=A0A7W9SSQ0_ARMRO|nr:hemolysin III family protein [Armatimonas rosea]MBB6051459.1 hemolysin III [Armatimonas rosea]